MKRFKSGLYSKLPTFILTLRLPERLQKKVKAAADEKEISVNDFIVGAVIDALDPGPIKNEWKVKRG